MRVQFDPESAAAMGLTEEQATLDIPDDLAAYSPERRKAWLREMIEESALAMLADVGAMYGRVPSPEQRAAYLEAVRPGIDTVTMEVGQ